MDRLELTGSVEQNAVVVLGQNANQQDLKLESAKHCRTSVGSKKKADASGLFFDGLEVCMVFVDALVSSKDEESR